jgi:hypothetical protein
MLMGLNMRETGFLVKQMVKGSRSYLIKQFFLESGRTTNLLKEKEYFNQVEMCMMESGIWVNQKEKGLKCGWMAESTKENSLMGSLLEKELKFLKMEKRGWDSGLEECFLKEILQKDFLRNRWRS